MKTLKRFKNKGLWIAVASLILLILQTIGVQISSEKYSVIVNAVLSILVLFGILRDPTIKNDEDENNE